MGILESKTADQKKKKGEEVSSQNTSTSTQNEKPKNFLKEVSKTTQSKHDKIKSIGGSLWMDIRKIYKFRKVISSTDIVTVRMALRRDDPVKSYAIKSILKKNLSEIDLLDIVKEVQIVSSLDHPNIIRFYEAYQDNMYLHLVMELCAGEEVFDKMTKFGGKIEENRAINLIYKALCAVNYCHTVGITHRDLKPENILFETLSVDAEIKLIDFGLSRKFELNEKLHTILGTPYYVAPEVLKGEYDHKNDVWSIGAICYMIICGNPPFTGKNNNDIFNSIISDEVKFEGEKWKDVSSNTIDFIRVCLDKNEYTRPTAQEALKHKVFDKITEEINNSLKKELFQKIKDFIPISRLKRVIFKLFLFNFLDLHELQPIRDSFLCLDTEKIGKIKIKNLIENAKKFGIELEMEHLKNSFMKVVDENSYIGYTGYIITTYDLDKLVTREKIINAFEHFDLDCDGVFTSNDFNSVLSRSGFIKIDNDEVEKVLYEVDKSGSLNVNQFLNLFNLQ